MKKSCFYLALLVGAVCFFPQRSEAYNEDVHFNLTYVMCRMTGLSQNDALWIADADQSMDDNLCTSAYIDPYKWLKNQKLSYQNGINWHDFSDANKKSGDTVRPFGSTITYTDGGAAAREAIRERLNTLWGRVPLVSGVDANTRIEADIALGQFLHFEQDYFSHRQFTKQYMSTDSFLPYGPRAGHSNDGNGHSADYVGLRPQLAALMAQDSYRYILKYAAVAGDMTTGIPSTYLNSIVDALASTYTLPKPLPANYDLDADTSVTPPSNQATINAALSSALSKLPFPPSWGTQLPQYDSGFALPYDNPDTPLSKVKGMVAALGNT